jgi:hypothetical protein
MRSNNNKFNIMTIETTNRPQQGGQGVTIPDKSEMAQATPN